MWPLGYSERKSWGFPEPLSRSRDGVAEGGRASYGDLDAPMLMRSPLAGLSWGRGIRDLGTLLRGTDRGTATRLSGQDYLNRFYRRQRPYGRHRGNQSAHDLRPF